MVECEWALTPCDMVAIGPSKCYQHHAPADLLDGKLAQNLGIMVKSRVRCVSARVGERGA